MVNISRDEYDDKEMPFEFDIFFETIDNLQLKQHIYRTKNNSTEFSIGKIELVKLVDPSILL